MSSTAPARPLRDLAASLGTAGAGLLVWLATSSVLVPAQAGPLQDLALLQAIGLGLAAACLLLGGAPLWLQPPPASPWRWRSRVAWALALAASLLLLGQRLWAAPGPALAIAYAIAAVATALAWLACQATLERGASGLWVPTRLALGLYAGLAVILALISWRWRGTMPAGAALPSLLMLGGLAAVLVLAARRTAGIRGWPMLLLVLLAVLPWLLATSAALLPRLGGWTLPVAALVVLAALVLERGQGPAGA